MERSPEGAKAQNHERKYLEHQTCAADAAMTVYVSVLFAYSIKF